MCILKISLLHKQEIVIVSHAFCEVVGHLLGVFFWLCFCRGREANTLHKTRGESILTKLA